MAGIAAMVLAGIFGTAMGLNNTATYYGQRRRIRCGVALGGQPDFPPPERRPRDPRLTPAARHDAGPALDADTSKREG